MSLGLKVPSVLETFVSSTDVVFDDDLPLGHDDDAAGTGSTSAASSVAGGGIKGRNTPTITRPSARASKTNALAALTARTTAKADKASDDGASSSALPDPPSPPPAHRNPARAAFKVPRAPPIDFSTLRTSAPRYPNPPPRPASRPERIFGLEHAPVFHPTIEEFARPMEYIERIAREAKDSGICKVVPPEGWRPPFAVNTETFRFWTRLQRLNSMEASARASLNFLEQLHIFHRQQGNSAISIPTISGKPVDLWRLKREVTNAGGYTLVTSDRKWTTVAKAMGYNVQNNTAICSQLKSCYWKIIVPFEDYVNRVKLAGGTLPPDPTILHDDSPVQPSVLKSDPSTPRETNGAESLATPQTEKENSVGRESTPTIKANDKVRTASDKLNEVLQSQREGSASSARGLLPPRDLKAPVDDPGEACEICTMDHDPDQIVLCDGCDRGYHLGCLTPPLAAVPVSQFFCDGCLLMEGAEYGFEEGEEHTLHSFRRRADAFKKQWLRDHPIPLGKGKEREAYPGHGGMDAQNIMSEQIMIEDHFEREFWRLVESPHETVEVEYGADINSPLDGGGMPNMELHPHDPYSRDGWNLNNLPILAGSLLRYIKSDISGMTIPWIYVGMVFSTFAWHAEDHATYSINYHHFGDTKTWYGIPGADGDKLEAAMKRAAPELFDQQPDLMYQLVTLMSPGRLKRRGVRVVALDQRPNEFVITFPRAYHSGFNHGLNMNSAVNFALPDWLPTGLKCVQRYREIKKNPVFSHDELLVTISQHEKSPRNSRWLLPSWREMLERELAARERVRRLVPDIVEEVVSEDLEEEEYQCEHCRTLAFLGSIVTEDGTGIACLDHHKTLPEGPFLMRLRYSDDELKAMFARVKSRSDKAGRVAENLLGPPQPLDPRTTGRKRKPSALALEAAGEDAPPAAQKIRLSGGSDSENDEEENEEEGMEVIEEEEDDADDARSPSHAASSSVSQSHSAYLVPPPPSPKLYRSNKFTMDVDPSPPSQQSVWAPPPPPRENTHSPSSSFATPIFVPRPSVSYAPLRDIM